MITRALGAAFLVLLGLLAAVPPPHVVAAPSRTTALTAAAPAAAPYVPTTRAVFSKPGQRRISALVTTNLRHAQPRSTVRVVMWKLSSWALARELVAASRRGVRVQVLVGGISCREPAYRLLRRDLARASRSTADCSYRSARGGRTFAGQETGLHQKSWTFTRTGTGRWVVVVTSANATPMADAFQYNDAYQVVGNRALHERFREVFDQQRRDRPLTRPFRTHRAGDTTVAFSPWNSASMSDPVVSRIRAIPPRGAVIRIAKSNWQDARGVAIARALVRKLEAGARVRVLTSRPFARSVRTLLVGAGARLETAYFSSRRYHHLKFMTAEHDGPSGRQTRVWTGSENWWGPSRGHDELVLGLTAPSAHRAYVRFFDDVWDDR
ncbi:phospholipase D-like domain-containing protein [Nocardioides psychrotolerans]|uniref:phospholipase D-like domain-containing protein n=1 Tax=Nocardioides psychrotolerans TaxID=1005945 RepID=UPI003137CDF5